MLTRDAILQAADLPPLEVEVKEWGGSVFVRMLPAQERIDMGEWGKADDADQVFLTRFCAAVICDDTGQRLFTDGDITALATKSANALTDIMEAAMMHNGMSGDDAAKNSETGPT